PRRAGYAATAGRTASRWQGGRRGPRSVPPQTPHRLREALLATQADVQVEPVEGEGTGAGRPRDLVQAENGDLVGLLAEAAGLADRGARPLVEGGRILADADVLERRVTGQLGHVDQQVGGRGRVVRVVAGPDHQADRRTGYDDRLAQLGQGGALDA